MRFLWLLMYSLLCAVLLTCFSNIHGISKYVFSLGALYLGMRFFRKFEQVGFRIWFVVISVLFYFIFSLIYALYTQLGITAP
ncbi:MULTISPECIES: hypothetical protein [unclassified Paenibacillus]|uniref:hypothetical protein n=1 Tax=unclassified Paenibacillus TaxID=185978 RepID=UPI00277E7E30|nr:MULTISPECIES: hypothetical protein [unclassified Paenibacillus]MDQ0899966.1 lipopolysaccharide export LptBFGC system permease protein LptF [Paenibacillus sp. V4I7]MDQ0914153.1 lipopolysaccharide export LptBFGC system permease protein LptF [Paenibacillus sp. V4I5]